MALNFFKQRDIDEIDVNDIPEEFINYLETLDEAGKIGLLASRPDIAKVLGVSVEDSNQDTVNTTDDSSEIVQEDERNPKSSAVFEEEQDIRNSVDVEPDVDEPEEVNEEFIAIQNNYYEGKRLAEILKDNMEPLEALAIPDKTDKCFIHRVLFKEKQIRYTGKGATYGVVLKICPQCNRIYLEESGKEYIHEALTKRNIAHTFYSLETSNQYLRSQIKAYEIADQDKIYIPEIWTEDNPLCPVHEEALFEIPCIKKYKDRKVEFTGYFCDKCNKILMRSSSVAELEDKNIIVQGCAGSGKTMVLLHRLSALKYRQRYFDFSQNALILTPNEQFSLHIKGLAEGLQIGSVHRISVEQYYLDMLLQYDSAFKPENKIVSEMQVRQDYVDYIYSDQFKNDFERAYNDILEKRNGLVDILIQLQEAMNQEKKTISWTEESRFTIQMKYSVDALNDLLRKKEQDFASAQDKITKAEERRAFLEDRIPASEQFAKSIVQESLPRVNTKIGEYVLEKQQEIEALNKKIQELQEEYARIQGALIIFGKRAKLEKLDADIEEVKAKVIPLQTQLDEQKKILSMRQDGKEDDEILAWMKQVSVYIKKVQDEVRLCSNAKEEYSRFFNELSESDDNIKAAYEGYHRVEAEQYSEEIKKTIQYLYEQLEKYSLVNIYQQIYDESVQVFKEKNGVKSITGKCHRYDLYVQLMFAMKYFNKKIGNMQFICVDEGQDLAVNEYRLLSELNQNHVVFNIFGDTNQLMKSGRGISDWNLLLSELQAEQYVLNENYRNTNQITRFCNDNFGLKTLQTGVDGPKVREISRRDLEKELAGLMITTERIAILLPRTVQKMKYLDMDILPENIRNMIGETMDNGFISVMYVDEVKGIEFDKVFVVSAAMHRNEKYIAYTRALSELIVVVDEKLMNNNSAKKVKENIEHNKKAGIHSAKMTGTLKWEKTKQPKAYTLEKTIDNDVITYHFTENTKSIIKNEFANTDSILPSSIASSPLTNIKKNIYAHCVYIENSICYNINCKENMGKKCNKEGNCDYYISLPVPPDEEELIAEDIDNAKKYLAKYS